MRPVNYKKKASLESTDYNSNESGFIAQELRKVIPTIVTEGTDKDKLLSVNYNSIIPILTKGIKERQKQIEELKALVNQLINKKN